MKKSFNQPSEIGRLKSPKFNREEMPTVDIDSMFKRGRLSCMESALTEASLSAALSPVKICRTRSLST